MLCYAFGLRVSKSKIMREIKFRGLSDTGNWYYGGIIPHYTTGYSLIPDPEGNDASCKNGTIGQFTGLQDKKGNDIYEGDIIISLVQSMRDDSITKVVGEVYFDEKLGGYMFGNKNSIDKEDDTIEFGVCMALSDSIEIIGNIYENPDLVIGVLEADA